MLKRYWIIFVFILLSPFPFTNTLAKGNINLADSSFTRPKLVVGIVVDQMRWDYLFRYYDRYEKGGFKRLLNTGFSSDNTYINYLPSKTALGHAAIFTGSVPSIHGITGNYWINNTNGHKEYCTGDSTVHAIGSNTDAGKMSPRHLLASTITDQLKLATNFRSKVVGVSLKDRASILPAGHTPDGAFWFDDSKGKFISSSYYMDKLPDWVNHFNQQNEPQKLLSDGWNTLYPKDTYKQSTADNVSWEGTFKGERSSVFPHNTQKFYKNDHGSIRATPFGNTLTLNFAKAAVEGYSLGADATPDFLTINCASTDYVGHKYGPNSIEIEDTYLRLDKKLAQLFKFLDQKVGEGEYLVFLTADHGGAHSVDFMKKHHIPADFINADSLTTKLNEVLRQHFNAEDLILTDDNLNISYDHRKIITQDLNFDAIKESTICYLYKQQGVQYVVDMQEASNSTLPGHIKTMIANTYNRKRSGDILIIPEPGWYRGPRKGTTHGAWNPYDTHIPLIFMGWHIKKGGTSKKSYITDIAPTIAELLHIQMPNGAIGTSIQAIADDQ